MMAVNNETGVVQDLEAVSELVASAGLPWHADLVAAAGKIPIDLSAHACRGITTASMSAHKCGGPHGVGALYLRQRHDMTPLFPGLLQEDGRRAGTPNLAGIVAFGAAMGVAVDPNLRALRDRLAHALLEALPGSRINGDPEHDDGRTLNVSVRRGGDWIDAEDELLELAAHGIAASTGAACVTGSGQPSHVLLAMGVSPEYHVEVEKRPFYVTKDGLGKPRMELFA